MGYFGRWLALLVLLLGVVLGGQAAARQAATHRQATARKPAARRAAKVHRPARRRTGHHAARRTGHRRTASRRSRRHAPVATRQFDLAPPDSAFLADHPGYPADFKPGLMRAADNRILTFDADPLHHFREAVQTLAEEGKGQVRVVHLGDSHLQADMLTGRLRERWQEPALGGYGSAGRGLVFPYTLARTNNPWDYRVTYTGTWLPRRSALPSHHTNWGLAGMAAATATAGATFTLRLVGASAARSPVTRVRVFYTLDDSSSYHVVCADSANIARYRVDAQGGYAEWSFWQPVTSLTFRVVQTRTQQSRLILQGLSLENDQPGVIYDVAGGNGATVESYLRCGRLRRQLTALNPAMVVVSLGTNDAYAPSFDSLAFRRSYATLLQELQRAVPHASILLTTPGDTYRNGRPNDARTSTVQRTIHELAEQTGCAVWDFYAVMGGPRAIDGWVAAGLAQKDRVHYTLRGYQLQGDLANLALREALRAAGPVAPPSLLSQPK